MIICHSVAERFVSYGADFSERSVSQCFGLRKISLNVNIVEMKIKVFALEVFNSC